MTATDRLALPARFSQVLVAYTIEFDNEFEHQMPHRTTRYGPGGPAPPVASDGRLSERGLVVTGVSEKSRTIGISEIGLSARAAADSDCRSSNSVGNRELALAHSAGAWKRWSVRNHLCSKV